jgi:hypothetical protein
VDTDSARILVVVPDRRKASLIADLQDHCVPGWERVVEVLADRGADTKNWPAVARQILDRLEEGVQVENTFVSRDAKYETARLKGRNLERRPYEKLKTALLKELDRRSLGWRSRFEAQMLGCGLQVTPTNDWLDQFRTLGFPDIGRMLLKNFSLMSSAEMVRAFEVLPTQTLGHRVFYAYFDDGDTAGSDLATKQTLLKLYQQSDVSEIQDLLVDPPPNALIYVFTDGLWSGAEFGKRILLLAPRLRDRPDVRVRFRFSAVADYGLLFARSLLLSESLLNVEIDIETQMIPVLGDQLAQAQALLSVGTHAEFAEKLHHLVEPYVCRQTQLGELDPARTRSFLYEVGYQLALGWVDWDEPHLDSQKKSDRAAKFALGGGGFGLAAAFHQSVPKVSLPVFWLGGSVIYEGNSVAWKPLLFDVRRQKPKQV